MSLEKTWRGFGPDDPITLSHLKQMGVEGVVTSLHHIPNGEVWSVEEISRRKELIESFGLRWSVVESLPVHEAIKFGGPQRAILIDNYKRSLKNLGECGIDTVCYNFMPVIDWIRTDLHYQLPSGAESLYFDFAWFVAFDLFILKRKGAEKDYPEQVVKEAMEIGKHLKDEDRKRLVDYVIVATQGFIDGVVNGSEADPVSVFNSFIDLYKGINSDVLRENLKYFLEQIIPVAEESNVQMCIHPDDPPFPALGLPRIVSTPEDIEWVLNAVSSPSNGLTFCMGSLGARKDNDLVRMVQKFCDRISFVHLRNTTPDGEYNFYESGHLTGRGDMFEILKSLLEEQERRQKAGRSDWRLPMRVDHGLRMLDDFDESYNPGYPLTGRLVGLAEIRGLEFGIERMLQRSH